ncbi:MAG: c-type cytochrome [Bryobacteraceae bacterium]
MKPILLVVAAFAASAASLPEVSSRRGAELFFSYGCSECHAVNGKGQRVAPDLGRRLDREYSAAGMASRMWNHAPTMWKAMGRSRSTIPTLSPADAADIFAFFYSVRYFEKPGDAARGKQVWMSKNCAACHGTPGPAGTATGKTIAKNVVEWRSLSDPVELVQQMWNHSSAMRTAAAEKKVKWPALTSQELTDLLVWLQNLPIARVENLHFSLPSGDKGAELLASKGCANCHKGALSLDDRLPNRTLTEVAAAMWNHAPKMAAQTAADIAGDDMREIVAYVWGRQFFQPKGDAARGGAVFQSRCGSCHGQGSSLGAPPVDQMHAERSAIEMVSALWRHGPRMLAELERQGKPWPNLSPAEMANVVSFLGRK